MAQRKISFDKWAEKFEPILNPKTMDAQFDTHADIEQVKAAELHNKAWTLVDADGKLYIIEGVHWVNRMAYFITENAYSAFDTYNIKY